MRGKSARRESQHFIRDQKRFCDQAEQPALLTRAIAFWKQTCSKYFLRSKCALGKSAASGVYAASAL